MRKTLQRIFAIAALFCSIAFGEKAFASHYQGSDLTYGHIGGDTYQVKFNVYRDCSGLPLSPTFTLNINCVGSSAGGRNITFQAYGTPIDGRPYCPALASRNVCTGQYDNFQTNTYIANVTFTAAEKACGMVRLSTSNNARPEIRNLVNAQSTNLYSEAIINLAPGINNNSSQFTSVNLPVPYLNVDVPVTFSVGAIDIENDSLVYSLQPALTAINTPIAYAQGFTYLNPVTASPALTLDPHTGSMALKPTVLSQGASSLGLNKYAVVVQVDEYRKVNGVIVKVGSVRRDMLITIIDCGPNSNPDVTNIFYGSKAVQANEIMDIKPGQHLYLQFEASDLNAGDILSLSSDANSVLPGASVSITSGPNPTGYIFFVPTAADIRSNPYYFNLIVNDNACPMKGYQVKTFGLRVSQNGAVSGTKKEIESLNSFVAYPNPAKAEVSFKIDLKKQTSLQSIVIFNSLGQEVERLSVKALNAGENNITWPNAHKHAAGTYTARLISVDKNSKTIQFSKLQ